ncbi:MAG TPA: GlsB/YeaQ/YmgE family stress response membrane protein [Patescibacteria group bacterium]|nr:GlsB/YeaQ/YmgE family stress response membrane protein [Patescibacteria group bacterium]
MNIIVWIVFGAIAGWLATIIMGENASFGWFANIVIGIVGAWLGGWVASLFGYAGVTGFNVRSFIVAIIGSIVLLLIISPFQHRRRLT